MIFRKGPELSPEEKKSPLAKYYDIPLTPLGPLYQQILDYGCPLDPKLAIKAENWLSLLKTTGYEKQEFSTDEIISYVSPLKVFGQVDFLLARRKYTQAMMTRSKKTPIFDGEFEVKTILPEDLIGLKIQVISNDPQNRYLVDTPDIQRLLAMYQDKMDMGLVREYFRVFDKEALLDEWINAVE